MPWAVGPAAAFVVPRIPSPERRSGLCGHQRHVLPLEEVAQAGVVAPTLERGSSYTANALKRYFAYCSYAIWVDGRYLVFDASTGCATAAGHPRLVQGGGGQGCRSRSRSPTAGEWRPAGRGAGLIPRLPAGGCPGSSIAMHKALTMRSPLHARDAVRRRCRRCGRPSTGGTGGMWNRAARCPCRRHIVMVHGCLPGCGCLLHCAGWANSEASGLDSVPPLKTCQTWCPRQDSNLRPSAPEADALSPELRGRTLFASRRLGFDSVAHRCRASRIRNGFGR